MATVSFYTDDETKARLEKLAVADQRSASNYLTLLVNRAWEAKNNQQPGGPKPYNTPVLTEKETEPASGGLV